MSHEERQAQKDELLKVIVEKYELDLKQLPELEDLIDDTFSLMHLKREDGTFDLERIFAVVIKKIATLSRIKEITSANEVKPVMNIFYKPGTPVSVRPCAEEFEGKTFFGIYIGDITQGVSGAIKDEKIEFSFSGHNPAILIPSLQKIVYGYESWWGEIKDESSIKDISDEDIMNVPYVKAIMELAKKE